ncbi:hypothetical protein [Nitratireductor sp. ZSWI3]|uniref:hypothetical protein n=1 Tax=Nitratireductor sp. ZSWI3 TaxID=2966359 RepID=UPI0021500402|nr:hypothetical protein [Nitratireductor sp. ZSWI3]MCR4268038.1 hypothetical protein [Nitratireductor sp. ZSWI3]
MIILQQHSRSTIMALAALATSLACGGAGASEFKCSGVDTHLTQQRQAEYKRLVAQAMEMKAKAAQIGIENFMQSGAWSAVYASTPVSDDGVLFFQTVDGKKRFKDVWGGYADPSERKELVDWAKDLGAPESLAKCFAHLIVDG